MSGDGWTPPVRVGSSTSLSGVQPVVLFNAVSPAFIDTLRMRLLEGRNFNDHDLATGPPVAIINQTFAQRFYPGINLVGEYFRTMNRPYQFGPPILVVGLAKNSNFLSLREDTWPVVLIPISQLPADQWDGLENFEVRTATPPSLVAPLVARAMVDVNRGISVEFRTLAQQVSDSVVQERVLALLSGFFSALALSLAAIGVYGTLTYLVAQRRKEFGIRVALGAQSGSILRLVFRDVVAILGIGVTAGLGISNAITGVLRSLLFGIGTWDTFTMAAAVAVLCVVAIIAGYIPARRATKVDPLVALRYE